MHDTLRLRPEVDLTFAQCAQTYGVPATATLAGSIRAEDLARVDPFAGLARRPGTDHAVVRAASSADRALIRPDHIVEVHAGPDPRAGLRRIEADPTLRRAAPSEFGIRLTGDVA